MQSKLYITVLMVLCSFVGMLGGGKSIPSFQPHDAAIREAAKNGNVEALVKAYNAAKNFVALYPEKRLHLQGAINTALLEAAKNSSLSDEDFSTIASKLIRYGANIEHKDSKGKTLEYYRKSFGAYSGKREYVGGEELEQMLKNGEQE